LPPLPPIYGIAEMTKSWFDYLAQGLRVNVLARGKRHSRLDWSHLLARGDEADGGYRVLGGLRWCARPAGLGDTHQYGCILMVNKARFEEIAELQRGIATLDPDLASSGLAVF